MIGLDHRGNLRFAIETRGQISAFLEDCRGEHLHRYLLLQEWIVAMIDGAHATFAQPSQQKSFAKNWDGLAADTLARSESENVIAGKVGHTILDVSRNLEFAIGSWNETNAR